MKSYRSLLIFLPCLVAFCLELWLCLRNWNWVSFSDPSFAYLLDSLNLATLHTVGMYQHPGTTLEIIAALFLWIAYFCLTSFSEGVVISVLKDPYYFLTFIGIGIYALQSLCMFFVGLVLLRKTKNFFLAFTIPAAILIMPAVLEITGALSLRCENLIPTLEYLLCLVGLLRYYEVKQKKETVTLGFFTGLLSGFAFFLKITLVPLFLVSFFFWKGLCKARAAWICGVMCVSGLCISIIGFDRFLHLFTWIHKLITHSGRYGSGDSTFIDLSYFLNNINTILVQNKVYLVILGMIVVFLIAKRCLWKYFSWKIVFGYVCAALVLLFLVAKHYLHHYLLPLYLPAIFICLINISNSSKHLKLCAVSIIIFMSVFTGIKIIEKPGVAPYELPPLSNGSVLISAYPASSLEYALAFGNGYAKSRYSAQLNAMYPNALFYNIWGGKFYTFMGAIPPTKFFTPDKKFYIWTANYGNDHFKNLVLGKEIAKFEDGTIIREILDIKS